MSPKLVIRKFLQSDESPVKDLILSIQTGEYGFKITAEDQPDLSQIPQFYQSGVGNFYVALVNDKVIGTLGFLDIGNQGVALRKMFVSKEFRGREFNVAQQLLNTSTQELSLRTVKQIYLGTTDRFLAAHRFYEKNGFKRIEKETLPKAFPIMGIDSIFYFRGI